MHNLLFSNAHAEILSSLPEVHQNGAGLAILGLSSSVLWVVGFIFGMILLSVVLPRWMSR